MAVIQQD